MVAGGCARIAGVLIAISIGGACAQRVCAQTKTALSWVRLPGAERCIPASELGRRVERVVGPVLTTAVAGEVSIEGRIAPAGRQFIAHVVVTDHAGEILGQRALRSSGGDCRALDDALVFVITIAIDPNAALAELPADLDASSDPGAELLQELRDHPPKPIFPRPSTAARRRPVRPAVAPERSAGPERAEFRVGLAGALGLGGLRVPWVGLGAQAAVAWDAWAYRVRGVGRLTQRDALGALELGVAQLDLAVCPRLWAGAGFALAACGGAALARISAEPLGFAGTPRVRWVFGPSLGLRLERAVAPGWFVALDVDAQSLWPRHRVGYEEGAQLRSLYRTPAVAGSSSLSLELRF